MAKRKKSKPTRRTKDTLDETPVLSLSHASVELLGELAKRERRDHSDILNDAIAAYAAAQDPGMNVRRPMHKKRKAARR